MQLFVRGSQIHTIQVNGSETVADVKVIEKLSLYKPGWNQILNFNTLS